MLLQRSSYLPPAFQSSPNAPPTLPKSQEIYRKSMDNLSNIHGTSIENLWTIYRKPMGILSNTYGQSIENLWAIYRTSMDNLSLSNRKSMDTLSLSKIYRTSMDNLSNIYQKSTKSVTEGCDMEGNEAADTKFEGWGVYVRTWRSQKPKLLVFHLFL